MSADSHITDSPMILNHVEGLGLNAAIGPSQVITGNNR